MSDRHPSCWPPAARAAICFPRFALAEELARRGIAVDLVTDMRGDRYGTGFPARAIHRVPVGDAGGPQSPLAAAQDRPRARRAAYARRSTLLRQGQARRRRSALAAIPTLSAAHRRAACAASRPRMHEQNAVLGRANRMLARARRPPSPPRSRRRSCSTARRAAKARFTGNPVRDAVHRLARRALSRRRPRRAASLLLVFGGSQGARYLLRGACRRRCALLPAEMRGRARASCSRRARRISTRVRAAYADGRHRGAISRRSSRDLPERMADAHLVIARAGASTVAELTVHRPARHPGAAAARP